MRGANNSIAKREVFQFERLQQRIVLSHNPILDVRYTASYSESNVGIEHDDHAMCGESTRCGENRGLANTRTIAALFEGLARHSLEGVVFRVSRYWPVRRGAKKEEAPPNGGASSQQTTTGRLLRQPGGKSFFQRLAMISEELDINLDPVHRILR